LFERGAKRPSQIKIHSRDQQRLTLEVLKQYLADRQATVLGNQFLYYAEGFPKLRVAPDLMVIFDVAPGGRDNYKIWEEKQVPAVSLRRFWLGLFGFSVAAEDF
jgi:hypothetical protein